MVLRDHRDTIEIAGNFPRCQFPSPPCGGGAQLSLSSKLVHSNPYNPLVSTSYGVVRTPILIPHLYSASSESFNLGFPKPDGTVDLSSMAVGSVARVRQVADLARHYSRCYWELSKARLRY